MGARLAYYLFVIPVSYLPMPVLYLLTDFFYLLLITIVPYRKQVIDGNLSRSFPSLSEKEIKSLRRKFYKHFTDILAEGIKNLSISEKQLLRRMTVKNPELMQELYAQGKSVLLISGHYNNWEWLISIQNTLFPHQAMGIGMPMTSKFWDKKVNARRQRFGMHVVHAKNFRQAIQDYKETPLAILVLSDQSPGDSRKSYWMNFLHQETAVLFGAEQMAHEYNFIPVFFHTRKVKRGYYELELTQITENPSSMPWGAITEAHTRLLEKAILEKPEYWVWSHKRWKRQLPEDLEALKLEQRAKFNEKYKY